jgi:hypothetical protein
LARKLHYDHRKLSLWLSLRFAFKTALVPNIAIPNFLLSNNCHHDPDLELSNNVPNESSLFNRHQHIRHLQHHDSNSRLHSVNMFPIDSLLMLFNGDILKPK